MTPIPRYCEKIGHPSCRVFVHCLSDGSGDGAQNATGDLSAMSGARYRIRLSGVMRGCVRMHFFPTVNGFVEVRHGYTQASYCYFPISRSSFERYLYLYGLDHPHVDTIGSKCDRLRPQKWVCLSELMEQNSFSGLAHKAMLTLCCATPALAW